MGRRDGEILQNHRIYLLIYRWALRMHPNKSKSWVVNKYFGHRDSKLGAWHFYGYTPIGRQKVKVYLSSMASIPIRRHVKIKCDANPYDPEYDEYFKKRREQKTPRNLWQDVLLPTAL
jgi:RNA-directed DNA polymerase